MNARTPSDLIRYLLAMPVDADTGQVVFAAAGEPMPFVPPESGLTLCVDAWCRWMPEADIVLVFTSDDSCFAVVDLAEYRR